MILAEELQLIRSVACKWCGCETGGVDHTTIEECVNALEREVAERRQALAARARGHADGMPPNAEAPGKPSKS